MGLRMIVGDLHPVTLLIADDHRLYVESLVIALEHQTTIPVRILDTVNNGDELLKKLQLHSPDIILLDLNMPVLNGLEVIPILRADYPKLKIMVVTKYSDPKFVKECLQIHGVSGYVLKTNTLAELLEGIYQVQRGHTYISKGLQIYPKDTLEDEASRFDESFQAKYNLTRRELEILSLIAHAKSNAEIADGLFISPQTVGAHRKNIMRKLNISSTAGLVRFAIENQLG
ncbi:MAG TPA: response regulator transcription factor [Saprospiraceae bacterium]|nr:response regulator transcription factor [Saprospiraceae bacterium]